MERAWLLTSASSRRATNITTERKETQERVREREDMSSRAKRSGLIFSCMGLTKELEKRATSTVLAVGVRDGIEYEVEGEERTVLDSGVNLGKTSSIRSLTVNVSSESPKNLSSQAGAHASFISSSSGPSRSPGHL
jgi:hypothetical protein